MVSETSLQAEVKYLTNGILENLFVFIYPNTILFIYFLCIKILFPGGDLCDFECLLCTEHASELGFTYVSRAGAAPMSTRWEIWLKLAF